MAVFLGVIPAIAQVSGTGLVSTESRRQILKNARVTVYSTEIPPNQSSAVKETNDTLTVTVSGEGKETVFRSKQELPEPVRHEASTPEPAPGVVKVRAAGTSLRLTNTGKDALRLVEIQFADPIGALEPPKAKRAHYCNEDNKKACVTENFLFCTPKLCAEEVTMTPEAKSTKHSHDTEHMLVAITNYSLADDVSGKGVVDRSVKSGGVEYLPAGITHVLTNTGKAEARFIAIIFR
jgi:hypothetical protein